MTRYSALGPGREFDLIRGFIRALPEHALLQTGPGDDAAVLRDGWVVSTDTSVEAVHFRRDWITPAEIGYRAAAVALSDLAAMAAEPVALLVAVALPAQDYGATIQEIMQGVREAADLFCCALAGGDTTRTNGPLVITVTVLGRTERPVLRSGAEPGDEVWVTGTLGGAAAALQAWEHGRIPEPAARQLFARPVPRIEPARWLAEQVGLHALIDLSDGLASDVAHLAAASGVHVEIESALLPVHAAARGQADGVRLALAGGDDYELCLAAAPAAIGPLAERFAARFHVPLTRVGRVSAGQGITIRAKHGEPLEGVSGYDHFRSLP